MQAKDFVDALIAQAPSEHELKQFGLPEDYIELRRKHTLLIQKAQNNLGDELLNLTSNYNASLIEISAVSLQEDVVEDIKYIIVGQMEVDPLVINRMTGEVQVYEHATDDHLLYNCAQNGSMFLDAMILADDFLNKCLLIDGLSDNQDAAKEMAIACSEAAGGEKYFNYYAEIVGYFC